MTEDLTTTAGEQPVDDIFDPEAEQDLSGEGLQRQRALFEIADAEVRPTKAGNGTLVRSGVRECRGG